MTTDAFEQPGALVDAPPDAIGWPPSQDSRPARWDELATEEAGARRRVLIVEDSRPLRELYRVVLKASGYHVTLADDGREGLAAALRDRPDLLMVDISMPVKDGVTMLEELRAAERRRRWASAPAVLLSASPLFPEVDTESLGVAAMLDKAHLPPRKIVSVVTAHLPRA